jgi:branched-chain amino acid transport system permease protein
MSDSENPSGHDRPPAQGASEAGAGGVHSEVFVAKGHAPRSGNPRPERRERAASRGAGELAAQLREWRDAFQRRLPPWWSRALAAVLIVGAIILPFFFAQTSGFINATIISFAYVVMALGLNIVVGFAGLLDLGYVAFYALGAYSVGWFGSGFFFKAHLHVGASHLQATLPGIHLNFVLIVVAAVLIAALAGVIIGLPTLRLRSDYIAIVTLAFGEIVRVFAINGTSIHLGGGQTLTAGNLGIPAVDLPYFPVIGSFNLLKLRPWYWLILALMLIVLFVNLRLRDSRLGRAWVALREDEVAAVSMGVPAVRTKLLAYAIGATFGGISGAFLGAYFTTVNAGQFAFSFSIFVLAMIIVGGLGSIWGAVLGALLLSYINYYLIPDVLNSLPRDFGLSFDLTQLSFGIFGFLLVLVMVLRPQGLFPERRRRLELTAEIAAEDAQLVESTSAV